MPSFQVETETLAGGAGVVVRGASDLSAAGAQVMRTGQAAAGTPAAGAYDALVADLGRTISTVQTSVADLSRAMSTAAGNYARSEQANAVCLAPGFAARG